MNDDKRPLPTISKDNQPFWEACREGRLVLPHCHRCDQAYWPPSPVCPVCFAGPPEWRSVSGRGIVSTFVVVHQPWFPAFKSELPYNVAQVELEEGPRLTTTIVQLGHEALAVGLEVEPVFEDNAETLGILKFRPRTVTRLNSELD